MKMRVTAATEGDFDAWIDLAKEAEYLFGPMEAEGSFGEVLRRNMGERRAFCIRENGLGPGTPLIGGVLISKRRNEIGWLVVAASHRRKGVGSKLLEHALSVLNSNEDITVKTFASDVLDGRPARAFYTSHGFEPTGKISESPSPFPNELFIKKCQD